MPPIAYQDLGRLLVNVCRLHRTRTDQSMDRIGLFSGQAILLAILSQHDGMTHSEIAEKLEISPAAATKVIKRMEQAGYVQRQPDRSDERVSRVYLRDKGHKVCAEIGQAFGMLDRTMFDGLTGPDLELFRELLTRMQANLQNWQR
jgi:DNA-binding MarR family transcriptional regulator